MIDTKTKTKTKSKPAKKQAKPRSKVAPSAAKPEISIRGRSINPETGLTPQRERFACLVAQGVSQSEAYRQAYPRSVQWKPEALHSEASRTSANHMVAARIRELMAAAADDSTVEVKDVLRRYVTQLNADPRALSAIHVAPCRYCYGKGHRYQRTDGELEDDRDRWEEKRDGLLAANKPDPGEFSEKGGGGFDARKKPNPECPKCAGHGDPRVILKDSTGYDEAALALYMGAEEGKDGIKVKTLDRSKALDAVARHVDFFQRDNESGTKVFDPDDLARRFGSTIERSFERHAAMLAERAGLDKAGG